MKRNYTFRFYSPIDETIDAISSMLTYHSVEHTINAYEIASTKIPTPMASFDRRQNSRYNWIGINPFMCIDKLKIIARCGATQTCIVEVSVLSYRVYVPMVILLALSIYILWKEHELVGVIFFSITSLIAGLFTYFAILGSALSQEIENCSNQRVDLISAHAQSSSQ